MQRWSGVWRRLFPGDDKSHQRLAALIDESGPYKGLRPYTEADQDNFFARVADCRILIDKILANRLTLLFAASGVGKSSLLQAAVLPRLKDPRHENLDVIYHSDWVTPPFTGLKEAVIATLKERSRIDEDALPEDLDTFPLADFFGFCTLFTRQPLVLMLDQFEEFFQYQRYCEDFRPFIRELAALIINREVPVAVVISMREDFALELNAFKPALPTLLFENFYRLEKLSKDRAKEAIVEPVEQRGYRYEEELLDELIEDLAAREQEASSATPVGEYRDTVEPAYLQIVCAQLWNLRDRSTRRLTRNAYTERGRAGKFLETYVGNVIGCFSTNEKRLVSKAFDHLVTQHGTKMAYTAGTLADTVQVNEQALIDVLERLHRNFVLRRQSREGVFWYELYHDLFSGPIGEWNEEYKARQRVRRTVWGGVSVVLIGVALVLGYNGLVNYTHHFLRLSVKEGLSDTVELNRGKAGAWDFWGLQRYIAETPIQRRQIEPDKLFTDKPVGDLVDLNIEVIQLLPLENRIGAYWKAGYTDKVADLAATSISAHDMDRSRAILNELKGFRSLEVIDWLARELQSTNNPDLKKSIVEVLPVIGNTSSATGQRAVEPLIDLITNQSSEIRNSAQEALVRLGDVAVQPLVELLADPDSGVRRTAMAALGRLGSEAAVKPFTDLLTDKSWQVRRHAAEVLGRLGSEAALEPLMDRLADEDRRVRQAAAEALGRLGGEAAVKPLMDRLADEDSRVREKAAEALGRLGNEAAVEPLVSLIRDNLYKEARSSAEETSSGLASEPVVEWNRYRTDLDREVLKSAAEALVRLGSTAVKPLIGLLTDQNGSVRQKAAEVLGQLGSEAAVEPLIDRLTDQNIFVRMNTAEALGRLGNKAAVEPLMDRLTDPDNGVRNKTVEALVRLGSEAAVEPLIDRLTDQNKFVRTNTAEALGRLGSEAAVEPLIDRLTDHYEYVRQNAAEALVRLSSEAAVEPLIGLLMDQNRRVRVEATAALGRLGSKAAVEPLVNLLTDTDRWVRGNAAWALGELGSEAAVEPLVELLTVPNGELRLSAAEALSGLGSEAAVEPLLGLLTDWNEDVRRKAARALGELGSEAAVKPLVGLLTDPDSGVGSNAAWALGHLGSEAAVEPLLGLLTDQDSGVRSDSLSAFTQLQQVRSNAVWALGRLGNEAAVEPLVDLLKDEIRWVRKYAAESLGSLGIEAAVEPLIGLLTDQFNDVRLSAAEALSRLGSEAAVEPLVELLTDQDKDVRVASLLALAHIGEERTSDAIASVFHDKKEEDSVRLVAAATLLALGKRDGLPMLEAMVGSKRVSDRKEVAKALGASPQKTSAAMLNPLLNDKIISVRIQAAESLGKIKAASARPGLENLLSDSSINVQRTVVKALAGIAAPESVPALRDYISKSNTVFATRRLALEALGKIGNDDAIMVIMSVCAEGGVAELAACKRLGEIQASQALALLTEKLAEVQQRARKWREIRDSEHEDFSEKQREDWQKQLADHRPDPIRAFELARTIARIDPDNTGIELLSHDLFNVRYGAWMGLGSVGTVELLRNIHFKRQESQDPLFRYATYRAMDGILIYLGVHGEQEALKALETFYTPQLAVEEGVGARMAWTIKLIESRVQ